LLLVGLEELKMSLPTPDTYVITVEQVVAAVQDFSSDVSPNDLDLNADHLSFFLAATRRD
jgi:hypothetical protein